MKLMRLTTRCRTAAVDGCNEVLLARMASKGTRSWSGQGTVAYSLINRRPGGLTIQNGRSTRAGPAMAVGVPVSSDHFSCEASSHVVAEAPARNAVGQDVARAFGVEPL